MPLDDQARLAALPEQQHLRDGEIGITWLGTAGHIIRGASFTILIDPYVTRLSLKQVAGGFATPDETLVARVFKKADYIFISHSHFDHLLDAPAIARHTGALLVGSRDTCNAAIGYGLAPERCRVIYHGDEVDFGGFTLRAIPSVHAGVFAGEEPFPGHITRPFNWPAKADRFRTGDVFSFLFDFHPLTVYHNGSADLLDKYLAGVHADIALVGVASSQFTKNYFQRLLAPLAPRVIIPTHFDDFFVEFREPAPHLLGVNLPRLIAEARQLCPQAEIVIP
ncbi:MAG: MBL fold metallo-hydrolase, partial [Pseudomonadota bacterium]